VQDHCCYAVVSALAEFLVEKYWKSYAVLLLFSSSDPLTLWCHNVSHCHNTIHSTGVKWQIVTPSVLRCCWLGLLTCKTHYRVREPTAAWQCVDICQHRSFDNGWQYVSCGQRQPPLSGVVPQSAPVNKWLSTITRERQIPQDPEYGGFPHLFGTFLSPHIGNAWRARHDNNNNNKSYLLFQMFRNAYDIILMWEQLDYELNGWSEKLSAFIWPCFQSKKSETWS